MLTSKISKLFRYFSKEIEKVMKRPCRYDDDFKHGSTFGITGPLWGGSTGLQWIPFTKSHNKTEHRCYLCCSFEQTVEQTVELFLIWDAPKLMSLHCNDFCKRDIVYPGENAQLYSRIPLSRAPLTRENQLVALAPWTPNFSDAPLATARMTDR